MGIKGVKNLYPVQCGLCKKEYFVNRCRLLKTKFCSRICQLKGQIWTDERKRKIGNATRGKREASSGFKNYNWNGGNWSYQKKVARKRDKDICQCLEKCSFHNKKCNFSDSYIMHVDHIKPKRLFPELALDIKNMITLCPNCHQYKTNRERRAKLFKNVGKPKKNV